MKWLRKYNRRETVPSAGLPVSVLKCLFLSYNRQLYVTHSLFDVAGEDVNLEVLRAPVTLGEGKTVTFH